MPRITISRLMWITALVAVALLGVLPTVLALLTSATYSAVKSKGERRIILAAFSAAGWLTILAGFVGGGGRYRMSSPANSMIVRTYELIFRPIIPPPFTSLKDADAWVNGLMATVNHVLIVGHAIAAIVIACLAAAITWLILGLYPPFVRLIRRWFRIRRPAETS